MIAIIDYGAGNLKNVSKAFDFLGIKNTVTNDPHIIMEASHAVLPGVGSFGDCMAQLRRTQLDLVIHDFINSGRPFLGICLGMQLLFEESEESPGVSGLGVFKGKIRRIPDAPGIKIPHIGWNDIECEGTLFNSLPEKPYMYFVHSYYLDAFDKSIVSARVFYGSELEVAIEHKNVFATQFHPEKSGADGLKILHNFARSEGYDVR